MFRFTLAYLIHYWGGVYRFIGNRYNMAEAHRVAVRLFSLAYQVDVSYRKARLDRGILHWRELGKFKEALGDFDALLEEDPGYVQALFNRAMAYQGCGRFADAIRDLENYLELTAVEDDYYPVAKRNLILLKGLLEERDA